jgi:hypothetical protein
MNLPQNPLSAQANEPIDSPCLPRSKGDLAPNRAEYFALLYRERYGDMDRLEMERHAPLPPAPDHERHEELYLPVTRLEAWRNLSELNRTVREVDGYLGFWRYRDSAIPAAEGGEA